MYNLSPRKFVSLRLSIFRQITSHKKMVNCLKTVDKLSKKSFSEQIHKIISPLRPIRLRTNFTHKKVTVSTPVLGNIDSVPHAEQRLLSTVDQASWLPLALAATNEWVSSVGLCGCGACILVRHCYGVDSKRLLLLVHGSKHFPCIEKLRLVDQWLYIPAVVLITACAAANWINSVLVN